MTEKADTHDGDGRSRAATDWHAVFAALPAGVVVQDADGRVVAVNEAACRILHLTVDQLTGRDSYDPRWRALREDGSPFPVDERPAIVTLRTGEPVDNVVMGVETGDGVRRWIRINSRLLDDAPVRRALTTFVDVSAEHTRLATLTNAADATELFRQAFEDAPIGMAMTTVDGDESVIVRANRLYAHAVGYEPADIVGRRTSDFTHPDDRDAAATARHRLLAGESAFERVRIRVVRRDGSAVWHNLSRSLMRDPSGAPRYMLAQLEDASETQGLISHLSVLAHTDPLTGLTNRRGFEIELEGLLSDPVGAGHAALFFLDLNGFKLVNDRLGHRAGDDALRVIADRLRSLTRAHDTVARVGGDEFVILARQVGADPAAAQLAERFGQALLRPPGAPDVVVRASVGVAVPQAGDTAQALIERADRAMYAAKRDQGTVSDERP